MTIPGMTTDLHELFDNNRAWARETERRTPGFFSKLMAQQSPQYMWIGCADSRVPANDIVGLLPGELFVHRNVANVVVHSDLNCLSVLQFAIDVLGVKHIMVVGHYGCSGVRAALTDRRVGLADNWLRHVRDVRQHHQAWLDSLPESIRHDALCELNVLEQVLNVTNTTVIQDAWARGQDVVIHGWVYGLQDGLVQDLRMTVSSAEQARADFDEALAGVKARIEARCSRTS